MKWIIRYKGKVVRAGKTGPRITVNASTEEEARYKFWLKNRGLTQKWIEAFAAVLVLALAACHDVVAPSHCEWITQKGLHADTTVMDCRK